MEMLLRKACFRKVGPPGQDVIRCNFTYCCNECVKSIDSVRECQLFWSEWEAKGV